MLNLGSIIHAMRMRISTVRPVETCWERMTERICST